MSAVVATVSATRPYGARKPDAPGEIRARSGAISSRLINFYAKAERGGRIGIQRAVFAGDRPFLRQSLEGG